MARKSKEERQHRKRKEKHKKKLRRKDAENADYYLFMACGDFDAGRFDSAAANAEKALRIRPRHNYTLRLLLDIAVERNDVPAIERHARLSNELAPELKLWCFLGRTLESQSKWDEAVSCYEEILAELKGKRRKGYKEIRREVGERLEMCRELAEIDLRERDAAHGKQAAAKQKKKDGKSRGGKDFSLSTAYQELIPQAPVAFRFDDAEVRNALSGGTYESLESYALNIEAHRILFIAGFDDLLCLNALRGVEHFPYQIETARRVLRQFRGRALLCDEVGLGKTIEAGMIIKEYIMRGLAKRLLVLVPPSLVSQWREELEAKFGLRFTTTDNPLYKKDPKAFWARNDAIISSIATAKSGRNFGFVSENEYDMVVIDEAHHLKNRTTLNWKLSNSLRSRFLLMLTATPVQNNLMELHNLITILKPGQLKTAGIFKRKFQKKGAPLTPANREELRRLLAEVMVRNRRSDVEIEMPRRHASTVRLSLAQDEADLYARLTEFVRSRYPTEPASRRLLLITLQREAGSSPFALASTLEKLAVSCPFKEAAGELQELASSARAITSSAKAEHLIRAIGENKDQKIIFTQYIATQTYISRELDRAGVPHVLFSGSMSAEAKDKSVDRFRRGEAEVLLSTESGGEGRNLQFCNTIFNYDLPWNPMRIEQRIGRVHRIGQTREVFVFNMSAKGTVEDHLLDVLDRKINMFELVVGEIEMILGNMTDERDFPDIVMALWAGAQSDGEAAAGFEKLGMDLLSAKTAYGEAKALDEALFGDDYEI